MGYGLVALIQSRGDVSVLEQKGRGLLSLSVVGAFVLAIVLHTLWDTVNSLGGITAGGLIIVILGNVAIAAISLTLLIRRMREAVRYGELGTT